MHSHLKGNQVFENEAQKALVMCDKSIHSTNNKNPAPDINYLLITFYIIEVLLDCKIIHITFFFFFFFLFYGATTLKESWPSRQYPSI